MRSRLFVRVNGSAETVLEVEEITLPAYENFLKAKAHLSAEQILARRIGLHARIGDRAELMPAEGDSEELKAVDREFWTALNTGIVNRLTTSAEFPNVKKRLSKSDIDAVDAVIASQLDPFAAVITRARELTSKARRRLQMSWAANLNDPLGVCAAENKLEASVGVGDLRQNGRCTSKGLSGVN